MDTEDVFHKLFLMHADKKGCLQKPEEWGAYVKDLVESGCIELSEAPPLHRFWEDKLEAATAFGVERPVDLSFAQFQEFLVASVPADPVLTICQTETDVVVQETARLLALAEKWGSNGLDVAHSRQLRVLLQQIATLQSVVVGQLDRSVMDKAMEMEQHREKCLLASGGQSAGSGRVNPIVFQKQHLSDIERRLGQCRIPPSRCRVNFRHISCNGPHILGHAPFYRCGMPPRRVKVQPANVAVGVQVVHADDRSPSGVALECMFGERVDLSRAQAREKVVPYEVEVVEVKGLLPPAMAAAVYAEAAAHRELALSPYFAAMCGMAAGKASTAIAYEHIQGVSLHALLAESGGMCETQPVYRYWSSQILKALCDLEEQNTFELTAPLSLHHVFISNRGTRVTLGRLPWGKQVDPNDGHLAAKLGSRSSLIATSFAIMLRGMLLTPLSEGKGSDDEGEGEAAGATGKGKGKGKAASVGRVFGQRECLRGLHVQVGDRFAMELPTDTDRGYSWDFPIVVAQVPSGSARHVDGLTATSVASLKPCGKRSVRSVESGTGEAVAMTSIPLQATQVGSFSLLMYHRRAWEPLTKHPSLLMQISVHSKDVSPVLRAVIAGCERSVKVAGEAAGAGGPAVAVAEHKLPLSVSSLKHHPYFNPSIPLTAVAADFEGACR